MQLLDVFFFRGAKRRVRNSHGKRAISVRATEVLLYLYLEFLIKSLPTV